MKILKICPNSAEAGFLRSLLESEGITAFISDSGVQISGVSQVRLEVAEEDFEQALIVISPAAKGEQDNAQARDPHPTVGYPFLGIASFVAILAVIAGTGLNLWRFYKGIWEPGTTITQVLATSVAVSTFFGLILGCMIAFVGLLARPIMKKLKSSEPSVKGNRNEP